MPSGGHESASEPAAEPVRDLGSDPGIGGRARRARAGLADLCRRRLDGRAVRRTEALVVGRYPELVRLAYLILPPGLERHRRVLTAHALVQGALPGRRRDLGRRPGAAGMDDAELVRLRIVRGALLRCRSTGRWATRPAVLPQVWGLRLFPPTGGVDEPAIEQALGRLSGPGRAAYVLRVLERLDPVGVAELLLIAGVEDIASAEAEADALAADPVGLADGPGSAAGRLLHAAHFDPCTLRATPSDLLRRRRRRRTALVAVAVAAVLAALVPYAGDATESGAPAAPAARAVVEPPRVVPADAWTTTTRLDFDVWSTRGARAGDQALTRRAVRAWVEPEPGTTVALGPGAAAGPPVGLPRLLYAGDVAGAAVVLLTDGTRLARYTEEQGGRRLDVAAADDSDARSASAVVLHRGVAGVRMLLAPWVDEAATRDLRRPDDKSRPLPVTDGTTAPMPDPGTVAKGCATVPVLELVSRRAADGHPYLLADLGEVSATHLTYMPPPEFAHTGRPAEAASTERALTVWSRTACVLETLRGRGLRLVDNWEFAHFDLPEAAGEGMWSCVHAFDRRGGGDVVVQFLPPGANATGAQTVERLADSPACSRSANDIVTATWWRARSGAWYLVAAGSRDVVRLTTSAPVTGSADARQLILKSPGTTPNTTARPQLVATLKSGSTIKPLT
ncbi:hypothetical protein B4N89_29415 [Embleya scabrispora]|uniref:DNA-directed RNA polymerase specialized sigma24 family protein n=1 Tax=Embleya scabrispora TaxID=159449 RepID=A0A1T3P5W7_9ACTN|nr:hypothetical protein [Embleya scabrispora]OPC84497.1 hypothetical protein B4N89_29415 [Embleya scabrispora]